MASTGDPSGLLFRPVLAAIVEIVKADREFYREHPHLRDADALYGTAVEDLPEGGRRLHFDEENYGEESYVDIDGDILLYVEQDHSAAKVWFRPNRSLRFVSRRRPAVGTEEHFLSGDQVRERVFAGMGKRPFCEELMEEILDILAVNYAWRPTQQRTHRHRFYMDSGQLDRAAVTIEY